LKLVKTVIRPVLL
jgi:hypothetical protein